MNRLIGILAVFSILSAAACNREEPQQPPSGAADTDAVNGTTSGLFERQRTELLAAAQAKLDAAQAKMEELRAKASEAGQGASEEMQQLQQTWQAKMQQAKHELDELRNSSAEKLATAKQKLNQITSDMEDIYDKAAARVMGEDTDEPPANRTEPQKGP